MHPRSADMHAALTAEPHAPRKRHRWPISAHARGPGEVCCISELAAYVSALRSHSQIITGG
eukprot:3785926-Prymnesium_polylepis.1